MKKAIGYIRISTKDQSNFSLSGQEKYIIDHCIKQEIELLAMFKDDGQSAKNFDRPDWLKLEQFVKDNFKQVNYLVVAKYDRFSRNVADALQMIEQLEKKYDIRIMSVMEPIALHPQSPYFFQFRTQMLVGAQVEWLVIRDRTRFGIHTANKNGRWINNAPIGYRNARDGQDKPILVIDELKSPFVRQVFQLFLEGNPIEEIRRILKERGFKIQGKSSLNRMLSNPVYAGMIKVNAYYDEPENLQKGIHAPLISEADWWRTQALIQGNKGRSHVIFNDSVPLRGALLCFCSKLLTAGNSKSKSGKYHWYYNCSNKTHTRFNLNANRLHDQFEQILQELSLPKAHVEYLQQKTASDLKNSMLDQKAELRSLEIQLKALSGKIESLEEKYIDNDVDKAFYRKWKSKYEEERVFVMTKISELMEPMEKQWERYQDQIDQLCNLKWLFQKATIAQKHSFIKLVFDNKLYYQDGFYRTPYLLPIFLTKAAPLKEKGLLIYEQSLSQSVEINVGSRYGNRTRLCPVKGGCPSR